MFLKLTTRPSDMFYKMQLLRHTRKLKFIDFFFGTRDKGPFYIFVFFDKRVHFINLQLNHWTYFIKGWSIDFLYLFKISSIYVRELNSVDMYNA